MKNHSGCEGISMVEIETRRVGFQFMNGRKRKLMKWGDIQGVSDCDWNKKKKKGSQLMQGRRNRAESGREELFALCIWIWEMGFNCLFKYGLGQVFSKGNI